MKGKVIILICNFWVMFCIPAIGNTIYVDNDATGSNDGSSWETAYTYLQDALADANSSEKPLKSI